MALSGGRYHRGPDVLGAGLVAADYQLAMLDEGSTIIAGT